MDHVHHYLRLRAGLIRALAAAPDATVLWPSISSTLLGHLRDLTTVAPAFRGHRHVYGVVHRGDFSTLFQGPTATTGRRLAGGLAGLVFLSPHLAEECSPWVPARKRKVIPNTVDDLMLFSRDEVEKKILYRYERDPGEPLRLLFLANMIASKGFMDVLAAMPLLRDSGLNVRADFVGRWVSDVERLQFERFVREHGLGGAVVHHGGLSDRNRVRQLLAEADVSLLPTYYPHEAQPLTIVEALNAATPVVATRHAAIPEMVADGVEGRLVPPRAPEAIARAVMDFQHLDFWIEASIAARKRFEVDFSATAVRGRWMDLIAESSTRRERKSMVSRAAWRDRDSVHEGPAGSS